MGTLVNINGAILPPDRAFISVFDRGFLYGDSIYEVCRTYRGALFELQAHLARLEASAARIGLQLPMPASELGAQMELTLSLAQLPDEAYVRLIVSRGAGEIALDPLAAVDPAYVIIAQPLKPPTAEAVALGVKVAIVAVQRNPREALDPAAKTGNYLNSVIAVAQARAEQAHEAILLDRQGNVTEGASSNIFLAQGQTLITPALEVGILPGITRRIVIDLARKAGLTVEERAVSRQELLSASEAFLASTIRELLPVRAVNETALPAPGPLTTRLRAMFRSYTEGTR
jgi:branched-chain amino acid aminotransferase